MATTGLDRSHASGRAPAWASACARSKSNATLTGDFQLCVFDLPGSTQGAILDFQRTTPGTVSVTTSQNLVHVAGGSRLWDRLPGIVYTVDPRIASDGFHLTGASRQTIPRTSGTSATIDIEAERRLTSTVGTAFGCDEIQP